jgi:hypothetical protein
MASLHANTAKARGPNILVFAVKKEPRETPLDPTRIWRTTALSAQSLNHGPTGLQTTRITTIEGLDCLKVGTNRPSDYLGG